jgi:hypothetical protein
MSEQVQGKFVLKKLTSFEDIKNGTVTEMPESDLCFQNENIIAQFKYERAEDESKYEIKPGIFTFTQTTGGLILSKVELKPRALLTTVDNTKKIMGEARTFFEKLEVYERLNRPKKRGVLLFSRPGLGKTSAIESVCQQFRTEDPGTVVVIWPTSEIEADSVVRFLTAGSEYAKDATRMILIIEDIGGGERDGDRGTSPVDSGLLNLLDGVGLTFRLPTFIVATTNHPENLLESLADRPGRFDLMLELSPPNHQEKIELLTFISKRELTDEEKACIGAKGTEDFSIAHLEEIAVRALLHDKTYPQVVDEMVNHSKRYKKAFAKNGGGVGFGARD